MKDTGIEWIGKIPEDWDVIRCKYISTFLNGYAFDSKDLQMGFMYPVIRIGDIKNGGIDTINCQGVNNNYDIKDYLIKENDILLAMSGATVGKVGIAHNIENAYINQRVGIIRTDCPSYLFYCLSTKEFVEYILLCANGSAQPNVSADVYREFSIPLPPKEIKIKIADFLDEKCVEIDTLHSDIEKQIETLEEYKKSIITEAVTKGLDPDVEMKDSGIEWIGMIPKHWDVQPVYSYFGERKNRNKLGKETNLLSLSYGNIIRKDINTNGGLLPENFNNYNIVEAKDIIIRSTDLQNDKHSLRTGLVTEHGIITSAYIDLYPKRTYEGTFRRKWLFLPLSARKTALFGAPQSTVFECSETVGGLLCGQQQFPRNNMSYTPLALTRGAIAFYTVIITLNST